MAFQCKNCAGSLTYDPKSGKLFCDTCGSHFDVDESEKKGFVDLQVLFKEKIDFAELEANVYTCSSCGGSIIVNSKEMTSFCQYCGHKGVIFDRVEKRRRPDAIIPFAFGTEEAEKKAREHLQSSAALSDKVKEMEFTCTRGIYIPYFIVSAKYEGLHNFEVLSKDRNGEYVVIQDYTKTVTCNLDKLALEASEALLDEASAAVEPYDLDGLVHFEEGYLQGFYSDMADETPEYLCTKAEKVSKRIVSESFPKSQIPPSSQPAGAEGHVHFEGKAVYALFPMWFVTGEIDGNQITTLVNGQTGKVVSGAPISNKSFGLHVFLLSLITVPVMAAIGIFLSSAWVKLMDYDYGWVPTVSVLLFALGIPLMTAVLVTLRDKTNVLFQKIKENNRTATSRRLFKFVRRRNGHG